MSHPIQNLIKRFENQIDTYQKSDYNETQTRIDFVNPFFIALGWDVDNKQGLAEPYRQVVHEDILKIKKAPYKRPDYSFRVGGVRKFFVEAKKPSINLKTDPEPAYQLRRYGWNAKLSLSIISNFAEFAVYDCRLKPNQTDDPSIGRVLYLRYTDYLEHWEKLVERFSFEAVWQGKFAQYAAQAAVSKGAVEVDTAFLNEMETWREKLAQHILVKNASLTQRQLNFVVQQTIDRIVFLRIGEDRGIEDYGRLLSLTNGKNIYKRLFRLFVQADERYNSGLFHFKEEKGRIQPDKLTPHLKIGDEVLQEIIENLYYPISPYEFSVLPADILGQIYERFLGKVICITNSKKAVVEEKPEVKKSGGVYYTPSYIVDYIVKQTVGKLLEGKKAKTFASRLKVLDPSCGSGSFLVGAYQFLLDWHLEQYLLTPDKWLKNKNPPIYQASGATWKLTISERKRILLNHIYGVDIDPQAVEITKLSLLLKVLEDEQSVISQIALFKERVLPDINNNIKCGNSLINNNFYQNQQLDLIDEETQYRINAFDWESEFVEVMKAGGFDAVIGNPPYVRQELLSESKPYFKEYYSVYHGVADLYVYFIEKGISLLREQGLFGIIVANKWMRTHYGRSLRRWLKQQRLIEINDFGDLPVFQQATTYPCILRVQKMPPKTIFSATIIKTLDFDDLNTYITDNCYEVQHTALNDDGCSLADKKTRALLDKLRQQGIPLNQYVDGKIYRGVLTGLNEAFVIDAKTRAKLIAKDANSEELIKPFLVGKDIKRYKMPVRSRYLILMKKGWTKNKSHGAKNAWIWLKNTYPSIAAHLKPFSKKAQKRYDQGEYWWELRACDYYEAFEKPKIIYPNICRKPEFTFDKAGFYANQKCFIIPIQDEYLLGILNSSITFFLFRLILPKLRGNFYEPSYVYFKDFPIRTIDFNNPTDKTTHDKIVQLVEQMLKFNKQLSAHNDPQTQTILERRIKATDKQIDQLVYRLYNLTAEEIEIVESDD